MYNTIKSKSTMNIKDLKMIPCVKCQEPMPELRLTKYGYNFCVNCSTVEGKVAKTMVYGSGDHTWNDIQILSAEDAERYEKQQELSKKIKFGDNAES